MISSAFKSAEVNKVSQQNQTINTITGGIKDAATAIAGAAGFAGGLGTGAVAQAAKYNLAGKIGGIGGAIMLSTMDDKVESAKISKEQSWNINEVKAMTSDVLGDNPINRNAMKQLDTVFNMLSRYGKGGEAYDNDR